MSQTEPRIVKTVRTIEGVTGPNATIWPVHEPALAQIPAQRFQGRVIVEVWEMGAAMAIRNSSDDFDKNRAIAALRDPNVDIITEAPWTDEPILGSVRSVPPQKYLGRVVVEVWEEHIAIAITGTAPASILAKRAAARTGGQLIHTKQEE